MNLNSRLRQLERIVMKKPAPSEPEPMGKRLLRVIPIWQLDVLGKAQQGRLGEDGARIAQ